MSNPLSWLSETFSSDASEDDIVKSRSLNSTRIAGVVFPVLGGIVAVISDLADKKPFNDEGFQKTLIVVFIAFIAVVTVADMFARAITTAAQMAATPPSAVNPHWIAVTLVKKDGSRVRGHVDLDPSNAATTFYSEDGTEPIACKIEDLDFQVSTGSSS